MIKNVIVVFDKINFYDIICNVNNKRLTKGEKNE